MSSYKCPKCGLVCWKTANACKRCQSPNPYLGHTNSVDAAQVALATSEISWPQPDTANDYINLQSSSASSTYVAATANNSNSASSQNLGQNVLDAIGSALRAVMPNEANLTNLESAERDIRWAWKAGRIGISLTLGFSLQYCFQSAQYFQYNFAYALFPLILIVPSSGINIGLIYGIYRKNRVCATVIFCLSVLSVLTSLVNCLLMLNLQALGSAFFSILFGYFYWLGVRGTFKYHHLTKP